MTPYEQGRAAARIGSIKPNPYPPDIPEGAQWISGYTDYHRQQQKRERDLAAAAFHAGVRIHSFDRWEC